VVNHRDSGETGTTCAEDERESLNPREKSQMKATELLKKQHREVEGLFGKVLKSDDAKERRALASQISEKLDGHTMIEEKIFYPAYREAAGTKKGEDRVLEAYEEHHVVKMVLAELPKVDASAENFEAKMTVLKELIAHHVEEEEKEMFPDAEKKLGKERLEELGEEMNKRVEQLTK
jgi:hemerythrin superfamily protein